MQEVSLDQVETIISDREEEYSNINEKQEGQMIL